MSPVSGGITLKRSHAYKPRRAFLNQWTGPERPFQHTLKQGHLTEMQVCGRATRRGEAEEQGHADGWWWRGGGQVGGLCVRALFTIPRENVAFHHHCFPLVHLSICICLSWPWKKHIYCTRIVHLSGKVSKFRRVIRREYDEVKVKATFFM